MHRGPAQERVAAHAEAGGELDFADDRLAVGHQRKRAVQPIDLHAGDVDAIELAIEGTGIDGKLYRDEGSSDGAARCCGFQLRHVEAEVADDAAHASGPQFQTIFNARERRHLPPLDLIERRLQLDHNIVESLNLGELIGLRGDVDRRAQLQPRLAIGGRHEDHGVADRGGLWRAGRHVCGGAAAGLADRAGH